MSDHEWPKYAVLHRHCARRPARRKPWQHLNDGAIRSAFFGARADGQARFKHQYLVDGTLRGIGSGRPFEGRWRVERDELCLTRVPETTYDLSPDGHLNFPTYGHLGLPHFARPPWTSHPSTGQACGRPLRVRDLPTAPRQEPSA